MLKREREREQGIKANYISYMDWVRMSGVYTCLSVRLGYPIHVSKDMDIRQNIHISSYPSFIIQVK